MILVVEAERVRLGPHKGHSMEAMNVHPVEHHEGYQVSHMQRWSCRIKANVGANSSSIHQCIKSVSRAI